MRTTTRLIAVFWLLIGASIWWSAWQGVPTPFSLRFFATLQVMGGVLLLMRIALGWIILITMSAFAMVSGLFALLSAPFMPAEMLQNAPSLLGIPPRWLVALTAALGVILGRLCWLGLRRDPPTQWGEPEPPSEKTE